VKDVSGHDSYIAVCPQAAAVRLSWQEEERQRVFDVTSVFYI
jgi:hypothetical protein